MIPKFKTDSFFRQCVGIDVAKAKFDACICMYDLASDEGCRTDGVEFPNNKTGFNQLMKWVRKEIVKGYPVSFVMEPTGVYHENLAFHLHKLSQTVFITLPTKSREFAKFNGIKTKTDKIDSYVLALMGCKNNLGKPWQPADPIFRTLRQHVRLKYQLVKLKTSISNNIEAFSNSFDPDKEIQKSYNGMLDKFESEIKTVEDRIIAILEKNPEIYDRIKKAATIKGVGLWTVVTILAETNGFEFISNRKQLASYAGLDVVARQSGPVDFVHKISKKGNARIRQALYMPAISASHNNPQQEGVYYRILAKHPKDAKIARTAVMRRLLLLIYTLWNNGEEYDPDRKTTSTPAKKDPDYDTYGRPLTLEAAGEYIPDNNLKKQADAYMHQLDEIVRHAGDFS